MINVACMWEQGDHLQGTRNVWPSCTPPRRFREEGRFGGTKSTTHDDPTDGVANRRSVGLADLVPNPLQEALRKLPLQFSRHCLQVHPDLEHIGDPAKLPPQRLRSRK